MINYETILSNYDDRLTLMQWLKKVEAALMAAALASVTITQPSADTAVFNFVFADGTSVSSPSLKLPRGPQGEQGTQGEQGAQGVGVSNVTINSNSHLIVTLTNGVEIDAGYIETGSGIVVDTELSPTSTNPVENRAIYNVVTTAQNTISALDGRVTNLQTDLTALGGRVTTEEGNLLALSQRVTTAEGAITTLQNDKLEEVKAADVDSENATSGQVLTADGNGGAAWQTPQGGGGVSFPFKFFADGRRTLSIYKQNEEVNELKAIKADFSQETLSTAIKQYPIDIDANSMPIALKIKADIANQLKITCNFKAYYLRYGNLTEYGELNANTEITFDGMAGGAIEVVLYPLETMVAENASVTIWYSAD